MNDDIERIEQRITELEIKAGFADDLIDKLNHTIFRQQQQIDLLLRELAHMRKRLEEGMNDGGAAGNERPPHY
jgi:SlyX protein